jgi:hypothetical protein
MQVVLKQQDELQEVVHGIRFVLEEYPPEFGVNILSMMLADSIMSSNDPLSSYSESRKIVRNFLTVLEEQKK